MYPASIKNAVLNSLRNGSTIAKASQTFNVAASTIELWSASDSSIPHQPKFSKRMTPEDKARIIELRKSCRTIAEIAKDVGFSVKTVAGFLKKHPETDFWHKGGVVSKTIPLYTDPEPMKTEAKTVSVTKTEAKTVSATKTEAKTVSTAKPELKKEDTIMPGELTLCTVHFKGKETDILYNISGNMVCFGSAFRVPTDKLDSFISELVKLREIANAISDDARKEQSL